ARFGVGEAAHDDVEQRQYEEQEQGDAGGQEEQQGRDPPPPGRGPGTGLRRRGGGGRWRVDGLGGGRHGGYLADLPARPALDHGVGVLDPPGLVLLQQGAPVGRKALNSFWMSL